MKHSKRFIFRTLLGIDIFIALLLSGLSVAAVRNPIPSGQEAYAIAAVFILFIQLILAFVLMLIANSLIRDKKAASQPVMLLDRFGQLSGWFILFVTFFMLTSPPRWLVGQ